MSDVLPLPPRPNLEQYKKLAKDFRRACTAGDERSVHELAKSWLKNVATLQGRKSDMETNKDIERDVARLVGHWRKSSVCKKACTLGAVQLFLAQEHDFASWAHFADHVRALEGTSDIQAFETAADAIVSGNIETLGSLLSTIPTLVHQRSTRTHHSTLLHYISANGVEGFRQQTPDNIVEIARLLIDAGADVNATSKAYGGGSTALGLVATSWHPEAAGVQNPLMELLIERGARVDYSDLKGLLYNGRAAAAEFFASHANRLDLDAAAGVGRLDLLEGHFDARGNLKPGATRRQMEEGLVLACEFGHADVVQFLLKRGVEVSAQGKGRATSLHWAAYEDYEPIVRMLLDHGAPLEAKDGQFGGTPLGWAVYGWGSSGGSDDTYCGTIAALVHAGAWLDTAWFDEDVDRAEVLEKARNHAGMTQCLQAARDPQ